MSEAEAEAQAIAERVKVFNRPPRAHEVAASNQAIDALLGKMRRDVELRKFAVEKSIEFCSKANSGHDPVALAVGLFNFINEDARKLIEKIEDSKDNE